MEEKDLATQAAEHLNWLKDYATTKFNELSAKADELSGEAQEEAKERLAKLTALRDEVTAHEGGALGFIADRANNLLAELREDADEAVVESQGFWERAKAYVADKVDDAREAFSGKDDDEKVA
jgi:hypothetical protein